MGNKRGTWLVWALALLMVISFAGCGGKGSAGAETTGSVSSAAEGPYNEDYAERMSAAGASASEGDLSPYGEGDTIEETGTSSARSGRKLITTVHMEAESEDYDGFLAWLHGRLAEAGGYVENSEIYADRNERRNCYLALRVPADKLEDFLSAVGENCNVLQRSTSEEDVTLQYVDTQSHRDALRVEQERLLELLGKAESLEDILALEERLTAVRYELQNYESALRVFDDQIDYSTVTLNLQEVVELTEPEPETWGSRAVSGMKDDARGILVFFQELGLFIVTHLPTLGLLGVIAVVVLLLTAKRRRQIRESRKEQKEILRSMQENAQKEKAGRQ
ncbi:DUF4349 domain-containing protein [Acutalibacter caecimuris]|uniref:DUF4349 domain-containing protein n=1 Tax=Acutalibacter caecimuris TaxID=3093657 RepID=UPI002AC9E36C|nr:DUF4349 domain-containing protein [Acutalibacter sp. M00118]